MPHNEIFKIRTSECDHKMKITPASILDLFQETAGRHCVPHRLDSPTLLKEEGKSWVLSSMVVEFNHYPVWPEKVDISTWAKSLKGFKAIRDYSVQTTDGVECIKGSSVWALLDMKKRRPCKIDFDNLEMKVYNDRHAIKDILPGQFDSFPELSGKGIEFKVLPQDIDINGHVSNITYVHWLFQYIDPNWKNSRELSLLNIAYRGEALEGDQLVFCSKLERNKGYHNIFNKNNGRIICQLETSWRKSHSI